MYLLPNIPEVFLPQLPLLEGAQGALKAGIPSSLSHSIFFFFGHAACYMGS